MMKIRETDQYYVVTFFPDAEEVEIDDRPEVGWKAVIGIQDGSHVVMKVMYDKSKFPLDAKDRAARGFPPDAKTVIDDYATNIGECAVCKQLDANVGKITEIKRLNDAPAIQTPMQPAPTQQSKTFDTGNPFQDLIARMMFDTKLNTTGQVVTALALEDEGLLMQVVPKSIGGVVDLIANITELSQGKGDIRRSPAEVTEFVKALREGVKAPIDGDKDKTSTTPTVFRRASTVIVS
jgi:hypothetical protein